MSTESVFEELVELSIALADEGKVETLLAKVLETTLSVTRADAAAFYTLDRLARYLHPVCFNYRGIVEGNQFDERVAIYGDKFTPNLSEPAAFAASTGSMVNIADITKTPGYDFDRIRALDKIAGTTTQALVIAPLTVQHNRTIGILQILNPRSEKNGTIGALNGALVAPLQGISAHAAVALWNGRLYEENQRLKKQLDMQNAELLQERTRVQTQIARKKAKPKGLIGDSPPIERAVKLITQAAGSVVPILLRGETGTGKEMMADFIHKASDRAAGPFVVQNCAALPEALLESELFGHVKGAFTGAGANKPGLAHEAHDGTLFLDEIGDMPLSLQAKVLRLLQEGEVRRVGSTKTETVDVRIVAATNVNLEEQIDKGAFRKDLYYRLNVFPIVVPPLRERPSDIPKLIDHFLAGAADGLGRSVPEVSSDALDTLMCWSYPGNVRELKNILDRAILIADGGQPIARQHLPMELGGVDGRNGPPPVDGVPDGDLKTIVANYEALVLEAKLRESDWNKSRAARSLNVSRRTMVEKLNRYDIRRPSSR